jgi:hypothetical protein
MSAGLYQCTECSPLISAPQVYVCSSPVVFAHMSLQGPVLPKCNLVVADFRLGQLVE